MLGSGWPTGPDRRQLADPKISTDNRKFLNVWKSKISPDDKSYVVILGKNKHICVNWLYYSCKYRFLLTIKEVVSNIQMSASLVSHNFSRTASKFRLRSSEAIRSGIRNDTFPCIARGVISLSVSCWLNLSNFLVITGQYFFLWNELISLNFCLFSLIPL